MNLLLMLAVPLAFGLAAWQLSHHLTGWSIRFAHRRDLLAHPNERSSHTAPTPRVGGIGFVVAVSVCFALVQLLAAPLQHLQRIEPFDPVAGFPFWGGLGTVVLAFALGFWDDQGNPPALAKLAGQIVVAAIPPAVGLVPRQLEFPFAGVWEVPFAAGVAVSFFWVLWMMNVVNFMDGINGLAGRFAQLFALAVAAIGLNRAWCWELVMWGAILYGAAEGFLRWNLPQAKTFLGDCGSQALGALVAVVVLLMVTNDLHWTPPRCDSFLGAAIIVSPFMFDVAVTLIRRAARGENLLKAHREHLYQRYLRASGEDHSAARWFVESRLIATAVIGSVYVRFSSPAQPAFRAVLLAAAAITLWTCWAGAARAERRAARQEH
ncbi:hypothetical protein HZA57_03380 [Candidatus Poribacteria bacterium]|nr:hypothetical protein [Candidatus Poribacteria bacterium]